MNSLAAGDAHGKCRNTSDRGETHKRVESSTRVITWNVAGVATNELDLCLRGNLCVARVGRSPASGTFVKTEGIESDSKHVIYTSERVGLGLRTPAIVVNEPRSRKSRVPGSGIRWVAVELM